MKKIIKEIVKFIGQLLLAIMIVIVINSSVFAITTVSGASMENSYHHSDKLFLDKLSYKLVDPNYGDTVVFLKHETIDGVWGSFKSTMRDLEMKLNGEVRRNRLLKRVIGLPGDIISIEGGTVYRNGIALEESYIKGITDKKTVDYPLTVPDQMVFVLGDNRENSSDSRSFGVVEFDSIEGKILITLWPINFKK